MHIGAQIGFTTFSADRLLMPKKRFLFLCEGLCSLLIKNPPAGWVLELLSYISSWVPANGLNMEVPTL